MDTTQPRPAGASREFVAALPTPRRVDVRVTVALVLAGTVLSMTAFAAHPLVAVGLAAATAAASSDRLRSATVITGAVVLHTITVAAIAAGGGGPSDLAAVWWEAPPVAPGTALVLAVLALGALATRARRLAPVTTLVLLSAGTVLVAADVAPHALVGMDPGTVIAALAIADRIASAGLRRPGDPGPLERGILVALALLPAAAANATQTTTTQTRLLVLTVVWASLAGVGLALASRRESRLRRTTDDLTALTALFVDSEDRGVLSVGRAGRVLAANQAAEAMLGAPGTSIVGHSVDEFVPARRRELHVGRRREFYTGRATRPMSASGPVEAVTLAGESVVLRIALRRVSGEDDRMMAVVENLTARRAEAEELRTRLERQEALLGQLRRLEALRNGILTATSHELRTPVTVLHGMTELLATRLADMDAETRDVLLQRQLAQSQKLVDLLDDLVTVDPDRELTTHPRVVPVNRMVAAITERWSRRNEGFPVTVLGHSVSAWVDPHSLERIVTTLLDNARTHGAAPVAIQVVPHDGGAQVTVSDSGSGIPVDLHDEIFQPFGRGASIDEANPGLGLGLPLARILAEADGGTLQAVSVRQGAMLQLTLARPPEDAGAIIGLDGTLDLLAASGPVVGPVARPASGTAGPGRQGATRATTIGVTHPT